MIVCKLVNSLKALSLEMRFVKAATIILPKIQESLQLLTFVTYLSE
jgi:hypothetical protein